MTPPRRGWWGRLPPAARRRAVQGKRALERRISPPWRIAVGVALILGGTVGFLPVLGFWMIPLGALVIAAELRRRRRERLRLPPRDVNGA
ncbi:MAG TPA: hypothetical protein DEA05_08575 [Rhodobacteraceae bacterium]|nr:hypothetical protein [Paracoccaceae bacterium]